MHGEGVRKVRHDKDRGRSAWDFPQGHWTRGIPQARLPVSIRKGNKAGAHSCPLLRQVPFAPQVEGRHVKRGALKGLLE